MTCRIRKAPSKHISSRLLIGRDHDYSCRGHIPMKSSAQASPIKVTGPLIPGK